MAATEAAWFTVTPGRAATKTNLCVLVLAVRVALTGLVLATCAIWPTHAVTVGVDTPLSVSRFTAPMEYT